MGHKSQWIQQLSEPSGKMPSLSAPARDVIKGVRS